MASKGASESEFLYHVKRTIYDFANDKSGQTQMVDILGTFTDLQAAKVAAKNGLFSEGYLKDDFAEYAENNKDEDWRHGDGVRVYAKAPAGQVFEVRLDTKPNVFKFKGNLSGEVEGYLHYVLQTMTNYNNDRTGGKQTTEVEGTYATRKQALEAARTVLLDNEVRKESFASYDEKDDERDINQWPYGDDVLVHAVSPNGENFNISVKAQPHSHRNHLCKHHGGNKCDCKCHHTEKGCMKKPCKHADCACNDTHQKEVGTKAVA